MQLFKRVLNESHCWNFSIYETWINIIIIIITHFYGSVFSILTSLPPNYYDHSIFVLPCWCRRLKAPMLICRINTKLNYKLVNEKLKGLIIWD